MKKIKKSEEKQKLDKYIEVHKKHPESIKESDARTMIGLASFNKIYKSLSKEYIKTSEEMMKIASETLPKDTVKIKKYQALYKKAEDLDQKELEDYSEAQIESLKIP